MREIDLNAYYFLKAKKQYLTKEQYYTIKGQIMAGDSAGAVKGIKRILARKKGVTNK